MFETLPKNYKFRGKKLTKNNAVNADLFFHESNNARFFETKEWPIKT